MLRSPDGAVPAGCAAWHWPRASASLVGLAAAAAWRMVRPRAPEPQSLQSGNGPVPHEIMAAFGIAPRPMSAAG